MSLLYLAVAILLEICGTTALKLSNGFTRIGPTSVVVVCYTTGSAVRSELGTALAAAIGILWLGEPAWYCS
jgi:small multidrug resistance pump